MNRAAWLQQRRAVLGGSEVWQVLLPELQAAGRDVILPYADAGPMKVWETKVLGVVDDPPADDDPREAGNRFERSIAEWAADKLGAELLPAEWRQGPEDWIGATGDFLLDFGDRTEGLEAKFVQFPQRFGLGDWDIWAGEHAPDFVQFQAMWCNLVYDTARWHIAAYIAGRGFVMFPAVERDPRWERWLIEHGRAWWQRHVVEGVMPQLDGTPATPRVLKRTYATHSDEVRRATADEAALLAAYIEARDAAAAADVGHQLAKSRLCAAIGPDLGIRDRGLGTATWREDKAGVRRLHIRRRRG